MPPLMKNPRMCAALERIDYQIKSALARRLTQWCEDVLATVLMSRRPNPDAPNEPLLASDARLKVVQREIKGRSDELIRLIKDELNLPVKEVTVIAHRAVNAYVIPHYKNVTHEERMETEQLYTGMPIKAPAEFKVNAILLKVAHGVDPFTGKLSDAAAEHYSITLGLFASMFMVSEIYRNVEDYTADEIAAVIMHELGHAVTMAEEARFMHHRATVVTDSLRYLSDTTGTGDVDAMIDALLTKVKEMPKSKDTERATTVLQRAKNMTDGEPKKHIFIQTILEILVYSVLSTYLNAIPATLVAQAEYKTADQRVTMHNASYIERIADEFVSRHGQSAALARALAKLNHLFEVATMRTSWDRAKVVGPMLVAVANGLTLFQTVMGIPWAALASAYDPEIERLRHLAVNNMTAFKDPKLPPELRDHMIASTQQALKVLDEYRGQKYVRLREFIWGTMLRMTTPGTVVGAVVDGNVHADYVKLQKLTANLIRTPLYYHAARVQALQGRS